ncbi:MAG TPA: hypothetical protein VGD03_10105 [Frankiaceae bacterium]
MTSAPASPDAAPVVCGWCGSPESAGSHDACRARAALDPPRWCSACGRRMVVQVVPTGWSARCSEHGTTVSGAATA